MANKEIERKIAVIFATDVVGYSKSVEVNEEWKFKNKKLENIFQTRMQKMLACANKSTTI